jgi:hypothetical protein
VRQAYELLALALALEDEGLGDDEVVSALATATEGHVVRLQSAYASTLYLLRETPLDTSAQRLANLLLMTLERVATHDIALDSPVDTAWLDTSEEGEAPGQRLADRLAQRAGDREAVLHDARRLQAELTRLRDARPAGPDA